MYKEEKKKKRKKSNLTFYFFNIMGSEKRKEIATSFHAHMQKSSCHNNTLKLEKEPCGDFNEGRIPVTCTYTEHHYTWFY